MKYAVGFTLYNPDIELLMENIRSISPQVDIILIIDNNSTNQSEITHHIGKHERIVYIQNMKNLGIACAMNQMIKYCENENIEWLLTMDQDSVIPNNIIKEYEKYISLYRVAIITPTIIEKKYSKDITNVSKLSNYEYIERCISSASLINVKICKELGYFDEIMFIDLVDFEYCARVRNEGYNIIKTNDVYLLHELGNTVIYRIFGQTIFVTNHSPLRYYYYTRNLFYFQNKHCSTVLKMELYQKLFKRVFKLIIFEKQKFSKISSMLKGYLEYKKMSTEE